MILPTVLVPCSSNKSGCNDCSGTVSVIQYVQYRYAFRNPVSDRAVSIPSYTKKSTVVSQHLEKTENSSSISFAQNSAQSMKKQCSPLKKCTTTTQQIENIEPMTILGFHSIGSKTNIYLMNFNLKSYKKYS